MTDARTQLDNAVRGTVADVPLNFSIIFAVQGEDGITAAHEVKRVWANLTNHEVIWITKHLQEYSHLTKALEDWDMKTGMVDYLTEELENQGTVNIMRNTHTGSLQIQLQQANNTISRQHEEIERLEKAVDNLAQALYDRASHG